MRGNPEISDEAFLFLIVLFLGSMGYLKLAPKVMAFYFAHRLSVAFGLSVIIVAILFGVGHLVAKRFRNPVREVTTAKDKDDAVLAGFTKSKRPVYVQHAFRRMHAQVIGTTNAGKTESVIVPWAVDDMKRRRGFIMIDGKSDRALLDKLYAYAERHGRLGDLRILSLVDTGISHTFNPLAGGSARCARRDSRR